MPSICGIKSSYCLILTLVVLYTASLLCFFVANYFRAVAVDSSSVLDVDGYGDSNGNGDKDINMYLSMPTGSMSSGRWDGDHGKIVDVRQSLRIYRPASYNSVRALAPALHPEASLIVARTSSSSSPSSSSPSSSSHVLQEQQLPTNVHWIHDLSKLSRMCSRIESKRVVLGMAEGIDDINFAIYAGSFAKHSNGSISIIFMSVESLSPRILEMSSKASIYIVLFHRKNLSPTFLHTFHSSTLRWLLYSLLFDSLQADFHTHYLDNKGSTPNPNSTNPTNPTNPTNLNASWIERYFDVILHLDTRDSVFQDDPFKYCTRSSEAYRSCQQLAVTMLEGDKVDIDSCYWNRRWVQACFNDKIYEAVKGQNVHCSGFMMGAARIMLEYTNLFNRILLGRSALSNRFPICEENGVDQGIHNVIISLGLLDGLRSISETDSGFPGSMALLSGSGVQGGTPMINLQSSAYLDTFIEQNSLDVEKLLAKNGGYLVDFWTVGAGNIPIVHQYDRVYKYMNQLVKSYAPWIDIMDVDSHIADSSCSTTYNFKKDMDLFKGVCDIGSRRVLTAKFCCDICSKKREESLDKFSNNIMRFDVKSLPLSNFFSPIEKECILSDANFSSPSAVLNSKESNNFFNRDYLLSHSETYKICTGFAYVEGVCFFKSCGRDADLSKSYEANPGTYSGFSYPIDMNPSQIPSPSSLLSFFNL